MVVLRYFFGGFLGCFSEGLMVIDKWFFWVHGLHWWFLSYLLVVTACGFFMCVSGLRVVWGWFN